jgi:peptidoglycan/xylan/chitin deacetylase (PgdA/CDA1 family)
VNLRRILVLLTVGLLAPACSHPRARFGTLMGYFDDQQSDVVYDVDTQVAAIALTIDDGPDPEWTPRILDLLEEHGAHATFFLIGERVNEYEDLVTSIVERGHELGNHMTADEASVDLLPEEFERQLTEADRLLSRWSKPRWVRPGSGWYDERMLETARRHGYRVALGSVYPLDAQIAWPAFASWFVLQGVGPGSVIVLHNGGARGERTWETLQKVLPELRRRGLEVLTLSALVARAEGEGAAEAMKADGAAVPGTP